MCAARHRLQYKGIASYASRRRMSRARIMDWVPGSHASTLAGNPVSDRSRATTIDILQREAIDNAEKVGAKILERLHGWKKTHALVGDVRGRGLMIGLELVGAGQNDTRACCNCPSQSPGNALLRKGLMTLAARPDPARPAPGSERRRSHRRARHPRRLPDAGRERTRACR